MELLLSTASAPVHAGLEPSAWVRRFAPLIRPGGRVLDVACGSGRHVRWLAAEGFAVTGVDRDAAAIAPLAGVAETVVADLENGPWPLSGRRFDAVVVTNYLWRPLWPCLRAALDDGAVLLYETFADGHQHIGRPARPDFLLRRGELLGVCDGLTVVAYEDGYEAAGPRFVQRVAAVHERPAGDAPARALPARHRLDGFPAAAGAAAPVPPRDGAGP